jgi:predicted O-methyltransferase YrrM
MTSIRALGEYFGRRIADGSLTGFSLDADALGFLSDKLVALDRPKAEFCYNVCRALRAKRVVEAGTSFGVSTLYLAAAVRQNAIEDGGVGLVIGTEHEPRKAAAARDHFKEAGVADLIELREGDLPGTLDHLHGPIDFMLIDIWTPVALPALNTMTLPFDGGLEFTVKV